MKKVCFLPYYDKKSLNQSIEQLYASDVIIFYFPALCKSWIKHLQEKGKKTLAYISVYKAPIINLTEMGTHFWGGAPSREELEINPFWSSASISGDIHEVCLDECGNMRRPFSSEKGKEKERKYKKGWYEACLFSDYRRKKLLIGLKKLLKTGVDGIFVDNVIRHNFCYSSECRGEQKDPSGVQTDLLNEFYDLVKEDNEQNLTFLNVGRKHLLKPKVHADVYVVENFCYGDNTKREKLFFAARYYSDKEDLLIEVKKAKKRLEKYDTRLLGYTKVKRDLPIKIKNKLLETSQNIADEAEILWTTRLKI